VRNIVFSFPVPVNGVLLKELPLEKSSTLETVVCLNKKNMQTKDYVEIGVDAEDYYKIKEGK